MGQLDMHNKQLASIKHGIIESCYDLSQEGHLAENPLKRVYGQIREYGGWYLRDELIRDYKNEVLHCWAYVLQVI